ncbi:MAG: hypothetical protein R3241_00985 [Rheinheimera sp.]|nr:hypothetical protein [Rheinheimera sp.]
MLSYLLLLSLALSGLSGSVQPVMASTLADAMAAQHQIAARDDSDMPCHAMNKPSDAPAETDCCDQAQHLCKADCCAKHCATTGALLATELFRYIRPDNRIARHNTSLPQWLFADDPPPPINA